MGFPRQEYYSGLLFPPPGNCPDPEVKLIPPALAGRLFTTELPEKSKYFLLPGNTQGPEVIGMNKNTNKQTLLLLSIYSRKGETMNGINTIIK